MQDQRRQQEGAASSTIGMLASEAGKQGATVSDRLTGTLAAELGGYIDGELLRMKKALGQEANEEDFQVLRRQMGSCLKALQELSQMGQIRPWQHVRLSPDEPPVEEPPFEERPLRLGFFPTAANPFHWIHLLGGLSAISQFQLDKVIYIIAGSDPRKANLLPAALRHQMGRKLLGAFSPFLAYSPISLESSLPGEVSVFQLLQLNAGRKIQAFYLAGTDHCRRFNPDTGAPDTLQRLEDGVRRKLYGFDERRHSLSVIFLDRGHPHQAADTFLDVKWIDRLPLHMSSTRIRDALCGRCPPGVLAGVPFSVFATACALGLYGISTPAGQMRWRLCRDPAQAVLLPYFRPVTAEPGSAYC
jgi:nicotinic acid mononucleotide adenylyltransferase